jgi:branched-subunit amino acid ABC-type transport system permease component
MIPRSGDCSSVVDDLVQALLNGLMAGAVLAVPAIGFTVLYAVLRFPNFAVGAFATVGAFAGWVANAQYGAPAWIALAAAFFVAGIAGVAGDEIALRRLRPSGPLTAAIGAVALNIVVENIVRFIWGNELRGYELPMMRDWRFAGLRLAPQEVWNAACALVVMLALFAFLRTTRMGKVMRAVADNPSLAALKGMNALTVARLANFVGMGLAGMGGMLIGLDTSIDPLVGSRVTLSVFAAAVVGGLGSIPGAVAGAFVIGVGEECSTLLLSPEYRTAVGFAAIVIVLSFRPRGLLGERAV